MSAQDYVAKHSYSRVISAYQNKTSQDIFHSQKLKH